VTGRPSAIDTAPAIRKSPSAPVLAAAKRASPLVLLFLCVESYHSKFQHPPLPPGFTLQQIHCYIQNTQIPPRLTIGTFSIPLNRETRTCMHGGYILHSRYTPDVHFGSISFRRGSWPVYCTLASLFSFCSYFFPFPFSFSLIFLLFFCFFLHFFIFPSLLLLFL